MRKLIYIALLLAFVFAAGFAVAEHYGYTDPELVEEWMRGLRQSTGSAAVVAGVIVALLVVDLLFPVPSSVVMALSGMLLGPVLGGLVSSLGAMAAACLGFWACRLGGKRAYRRLVSEEELGRTSEWFRRYGVIAIVISRPIPMLTEILSCLAGLTELPFRTFLLAALLGTVPICFVYSVVGSLGDMSDPWPVVWISIFVPAVGWLIARRIKKKPVKLENL